MTTSNSTEQQPEQEQPRHATYAERGYTGSIDSVFEILQETQVELSHMADSKANIMITVCSILLTLVVAQLQTGDLIIPTTIFAAFSGLALFFAILCVMPSVALPRLLRGTSDNSKKLNLLFFMNFSRMPVEQYVAELEKILTDPQQMYENLSRDVYFAGKVLADKKYRYLSWSYLNLMAGISTGALALIIELGFYS